MLLCLWRRAWTGACVCVLACSCWKLCRLLLKPTLPVAVSVWERWHGRVWLILKRSDDSVLLSVRPFHNITSYHTPKRVTEWTSNSANSNQPMEQVYWMKVVIVIKCVWKCSLCGFGYTTRHATTITVITHPGVPSAVEALWYIWSKIISEIMTFFVLTRCSLSLRHGSISSQTSVWSVMRVCLTAMNWCW